MGDRIYKTELHCHTAEISPCSQESPEDVIQKYLKGGYTSLTITNHCARRLFGENGYVPGNNYRENINALFDAIDHVRETAGDRMHILSGMEITFDENANDYLVFGVKRELFLDLEDLFAMGYREFYDYADANGMIFIQAHPSRFGMTTVVPDHLHGYEVFNGHGRNHSHNDITEAWARHYKDMDLILTSGTDNHHVWQYPTAGILTSEPITTDEQLLAVLRGGDYDLIRTPLGDAEY